MATSSISLAKQDTSGSGMADAETAAKQVTNAILLLMGVSGCGKSTVALELQRLLGWEFKEVTICIHRPTSRRCDPATR